MQFRITNVLVINLHISHISAENHSITENKPGLTYVQNKYFFFVWPISMRGLFFKCGVLLLE